MNEEYLKNLQKTFPSLKYFTIEGNSLILNYNGYYKIPLYHTNLSLINPNIFYLDPIEIFQVIYVLELLYKDSLNDNEIKFINDYTDNYLKYNDLALIGNNEASVKTWGLGIPIYTSYDEQFINNPASLLIQQNLIKHDNDTVNGKSKGPRLVRTNESVINFMPPEDEENPLVDYSKAGFAAVILIISAILITTLFITTFVLGH